MVTPAIGLVVETIDARLPLLAATAAPSSCVGDAVGAGVRAGVRDRTVPDTYPRTK